MLKLVKPDIKPLDVFLTCISRVEDPVLKASLIASIPELEVAASEYVKQALNLSFHNVPKHNPVAGVSNEEMKKVYKDRMVGQKSPGRSYYDSIKSGAKRKVCPLCGHRAVTTIDHYLPQAEYPALVVLPINLVPACGECNKTKRHIYPKNAEEVTLHPYFDLVDDKQWLGAKVIHTTPPTIEYFVNHPDEWSNLIYNRVKFHFKIFEIADLYSFQATAEITILQKRLNKLFLQGGISEVKEHLLEETDTRQSVSLNSWRTALYQALYKSDWYCAGGFRFE